MATVDPTILLKITNSDLLTKFMHECVDELVGRKQGSFDNYSGDIEWTKSDYENARNYIQNLYKNAVLDNDNIDIKINELGNSMKDSLLMCYNLRKDEILQAVIRENIVKTGQPLVKNIDWKLKWVLGSSQLVTICEPLLQVDLHCLENKGASTTTVNFELTVEQLDNLISELEKVKGEISQKT